MECHYCGNQNPHAFFTHQNQKLCRICISMIHQMDQVLKIREIQGHESDYELTFKLTPAQKDASQAISNLITKQDVLVEAICGAGKSELVLEAIKMALQNHQKVVWAIPRRQVVLQLQTRLQKVFKHLRVICVCEGYTDELDGDLIICTTHQLFRYHQKIDLLILDEPDAFPYKGNVMLERFMHNAVKGHIIYLSATPGKDLLKQVAEKQIGHVCLYTRPHYQPLCVPEIILSSEILMFWRLRSYLKTQKRQTLIFMSTIKDAKRYGKFLKIPVLTSQTLDKEKLISEFIQEKHQFLLCTTILERGVTFSNIDVMVVKANHQVFDCASLIQISGRVGRDIKHPFGSCIFLIHAQSKEVDQCLKLIRKANTYVTGVSNLSTTTPTP